VVFALAEAEDEGHEACDFNPELEDYRCVKKCGSGRNSSENLNICFGGCGSCYVDVVDWVYC